MIWTACVFVQFLQINTETNSTIGFLYNDHRVHPISCFCNWCNDSGLYCTSWSSSVFTILLKAKGIWRGTGKANGTASSFKEIFMGLLFIFRNVVSSENTSLYDFINLFSILLISASVGFSDIMNLVFSAFNMLANFRGVLMNLSVEDTCQVEC